MKLPLFLVDAFASTSFTGNPAAVVLLEQEIPAQLMRSIAAEMNLSETAFIIPQDENFGLRWFTPLVEVPLCGHATLAAAKIIFTELAYDSDTIAFSTLSGILKAVRRDANITLDFPVDEPVPIQELDPDLLRALGCNTPLTSFWGPSTKKLVLHVDSEEEVRNLKPNFQAMVDLSLPHIKGVGVTARSEGNYDFVSRYFNPWAGVNEDPVTGSVHTVLAPYWSRLLGKTELRAFQASQRGGELHLEVRSDGRLAVGGGAVVVLKGELRI